MGSRDRVEAEAHWKSLKTAPTKDISFPCGVCGLVIKAYLHSDGHLHTYREDRDCCRMCLEGFLYENDWKEVRVEHLTFEKERWAISGKKKGG